MTTLRDRCATFLGELKTNAILRQGSPVDDLIAFVIAETGRKALPRPDEALPLCLYFVTDADREEFIAAFREAKPHATVRKLP